MARADLHSGTTRRGFLQRTALGAIGAAALGCGGPPPAPSSVPPPAPSRPECDGSERSRHETRESRETDETHPRPLLASYPGLAAALPWLDLGGLPTPVTSHEALAARLGLGRLLVKRDDRAGDVYGGSKARKLEHLLAAAMAEGRPAVLTSGGVGSNHALATAVHARRLGLGCVLMLLPEPAGDHVRAHLLAERGLGCEQFPERGTDETAVRRVLALRGAGEAAPYVIPAGGTGALGTAGYVNGAFELAEQVEAGEAPVPDVIYVAAGTTGTAAGLALGLRAAGLPSRLVAVRASNRGTATEARLRREIEAAASLLGGLDLAFQPPVEAAAEPALLRLEHGAAGPGYAIPTPEGARAAALARDLGGLELDGTYTAKAFAALIDDAPRLAGQTVLFWNTFDPRPVGPGGARPADLPAPFRRYFF